MVLYIVMVVIGLIWNWLLGRPNILSRLEPHLTHHGLIANRPAIHPLSQHRQHHPVESLHVHITNEAWSPFHAQKLKMEAIVRDEEEKKTVSGTGCRRSDGPSSRSLMKVHIQG